MLKAVCEHVIAADSLMKIAWLSDFACGGPVEVGGLYLLYSVPLVMWMLSLTQTRKHWHIIKFIGHDFRHQLLYFQSMLQADLFAIQGMTIHEI